MSGSEARKVKYEIKSSGESRNVHVDVSGDFANEGVVYVNGEPILTLPVLQAFLRI